MSTRNPTLDIREALLEAHVQMLDPTETAKHVVSRLSEHGYSLVPVPKCDGDFGCPATLHIHGCYSDVGNCDDARDHDILIHAETAAAVEEPLS